MEPANPKPLVEAVKAKKQKINHPDQPIEEAFHEKLSFETPKMRWKRLYKEQRKKDEEAVIQRCQRMYRDQVQNAKRKLDIAEAAQRALHAATSPNPKATLERWPVKAREQITGFKHPANRPIGKAPNKPPFERCKMLYKEQIQNAKRKDGEAVQWGGMREKLSKPEVKARKRVNFALEPSTGESGQDPNSSITEAEMEKSRKAAVKAGKQVTRIQRPEKRPIGERLSNELVRNAKRKHAEAFRSTRHPAIAANTKPSRQLFEALKAIEKAKHPAERAIGVSEQNLNSVPTLDEKLKRWKKLHVNEHNNTMNLAKVEEFLRLMLQFPPKINPSGGGVDQAAKHKSDSPSITSSGHHAD